MCGKHTDESGRRQENAKEQVIVGNPIQKSTVTMCHLTVYLLHIARVCLILVVCSLTQLHCSVRYVVEPLQLAADVCQNGYNSARIAGDIDNAMLSLWGYSVAHLFAIPDLVGLHQKMITFTQQMVCRALDTRPLRVGCD